MATARFSFQTPPGSGDEFVFELNDDKLIKHARSLLAGDTAERPHVMGRIVHKKADYNPNFSFYLDPKTITFFDMAIEVCDASAEYTEDHLDEAGGAFLPGNHWCPWSSQLIREIKI